MIEMLKRPDGATVEQIAEATGWQHHTIRGAISGALKKEARAHGRGHPHPRGRPEQARRQGQQHGVPYHRVATGGRLSKGVPTMQHLLKRPGYRLYSPTRPGGRGPPRRAGPGPSRSRPRPRSPRIHQGHHGPDHRQDQRGRRVRHQPRGLATGPARRLQRALHPAPSGSTSTSLLGRVPAGSTARFVEDGTLPERHGPAPTSTGWPAAGEATAKNTDQLEHDMNELCHDWMHGKAPRTGSSERSRPPRGSSSSRRSQPGRRWRRTTRPSSWRLTTRAGCAGSSRRRSPTCEVSPASGPRSRSTPPLQPSRRRGHLGPTRGGPAAPTSRAPLAEELLIHVEFETGYRRIRADGPPPTAATARSREFPLRRRERPSSSRRTTDRTARAGATSGAPARTWALPSSGSSRATARSSGRRFPSRTT